MVGDSLHSVNITGGLHHAMRDRASGFCIYNDIAIGIQHLLDQGAQRIAYVDVDVHHGDGVERIFWNDPGCSRSRCTRRARCLPRHRLPRTSAARTPRDRR